MTTIVVTWTLIPSTTEVSDPCKMVYLDFERLIVEMNLSLHLDARLLKTQRHHLVFMWVQIVVTQTGINWYFQLGEFHYQTETTTCAILKNFKMSGQLLSNISLRFLSWHLLKTQVTKLEAYLILKQQSPKIYGLAISAAIEI